MPAPKRVLNAFTAPEVSAITGLSRAMVDYLRRENFLVPDYAGGTSRRGKVRYYSYRDLVSARLIQKLRDGGVEISRLKEAVTALKERCGVDGAIDALRLVVTDGKHVFAPVEGDILETLRQDGQLAFAFVVNIKNLEAEVRAIIPENKREHFDLAVRDLIIENTPKKRSNS